jgi:hypothetical protein
LPSIAWQTAGEFHTLADAGMRAVRASSVLGAFRVTRMVLIGQRSELQLPGMRAVRLVGTVNGRQR